MRPITKLEEWESKSTLVSYLAASDARTLLVGSEAEAPQRFYSFSVPCERGAVVVGVFSSHFGIDPAALLLEKTQRAVVGHDTSVTWIDVESASILSSRKLNGAFYEFLGREQQDTIVVLHELGALCFDLQGREKWAVSTDIVADASIDAHDNLVLTMLDGAPDVIVSIVSGKVSR